MRGRGGRGTAEAPLVLARGLAYSCSAARSPSDSPDARVASVPARARRRRAQPRGVARLFAEPGLRRHAPADNRRRLRRDGACAGAAFGVIAELSERRAARLDAALAPLLAAPIRDRHRPRLPHRAERLARPALQPLGDGPDHAARFRHRRRRLGLSLTLGLVLKETPFLLSSPSARSTRFRPRRTCAPRARSAIGPRRRGFSSSRRSFTRESVAGLRRARLCAVGRRHGAGACALASCAALDPRPALVAVAAISTTSFPARRRRRCNWRSSSPRSASGASPNRRRAPRPPSASRRRAARATRFAAVSSGVRRWRRSASASPRSSALACGLSRGAGRSLTRLPEQWSLEFLRGNALPTSRRPLDDDNRTRVGVRRSARSRSRVAGSKAKTGRGRRTEPVLIYHAAAVAADWRFCSARKRCSPRCARRLIGRRRLGACAVCVSHSDVWRSSDSWRALDPRYARAATALGAGRLANCFSRVKLPILLGPIAIAFAIGVSGQRRAVSCDAVCRRRPSDDFDDRSAGARQRRRPTGGRRSSAWLQAFLPIAFYLAALSDAASRLREAPPGAAIAMNAGSLVVDIIAIAIDGRAAHADLSFRVDAGEAMTIMGPSGPESRRCSRLSVAISTAVFRASRPGMAR